MYSVLFFGVHEQSDIGSHEKRNTRTETNMFQRPELGKRGLGKNAKYLNKVKFLEQEGVLNINCGCGYWKQACGAANHS